MFLRALVFLQVLLFLQVFVQVFLEPFLQLFVIELHFLKDLPLHFWLLPLQFQEQFLLPPLLLPRRLQPHHHLLNIPSICF